MSYLTHKRFLLLLTVIGWISGHNASPQALQALAYKLHGNQNAKTLYQQLGQEAQACIGLKDSQQVPVKKLAPTSSVYKKVAACSCNGAIFVDEDYLDYIKPAFGYLRVTIFHEVMHVKQFKKHGKFNVIDPQYSSIEKEADIEGAKLANCWCCTQCFARYSHNADDTCERAKKLRSIGYATKDELLAVAQQQKQCNALCAHHKKQLINNNTYKQTL